MAQRHQPLISQRRPRIADGAAIGTVVACAIAALIGMALVGLVGAGSAASLTGLHAIGPSLARHLGSAARQASLSTLLSVGLGAALALALHRRRDWPGQRLLLAVLTAAAVAPAIVVVFGIIAVHGRGGWLDSARQALGGSPLPSIFGLRGIILAHVALNAPLVARVLLQALDRVPAEQVRLATMLRFDAVACLRHLDWPVLRREMPALALLVFILCFTSFAIVLTLGGGPRQSTLEVAIYQALRIEADFARAAALAGLQIGLCLGLVALLGLVSPREAAATTLRVTPTGAGGASRPDAAHAGLRWLDGVVLLLGLVLVALPVLSTLTGLAHVSTLLHGEVLQGLLTSLGLAVMAAALSVALGLALAMGAASGLFAHQRQRRRLWFGLATMPLLALPPYAFVAGLFVWLRDVAPPAILGWGLVPLVNALMALPLVYRLLAPPLALMAEREGRLAAQIGIPLRTRLTRIDAPLLARPVAAALAFAGALSFGDFGVIALFGGGDLVTLPSLLYLALGTYRLDEASALAAVIVSLGLGLAVLGERAGQPRSEARVAHAAD